MAHKPENVRVGDHAFGGAFTVVVRTQAFPSPVIDLFEVMVHEHVGEATTYVDIIRDRRIGWFDDLTSGQFSRRVTPDDVITWNAYVERTTVVQPTWLMTRESVAALLDRVEQLIRKRKKN